MESMRSTWTDSRLDDFAANTDKRFDKLEEAIGEVRAEVIGVRGEVHALQRTIIQAGVAMFAALVGVIVTILGVIATQL
jgi:hypothetical protein